jgi:L-amino acid N-acyltransferase YncA
MPPPSCRDATRIVTVARIDAANPASIGLHERPGFERASALREVGARFACGVELLSLQRFLAAPEPIALRGP